MKPYAIHGFLSDDGTVLCDATDRVSQPSNRIRLDRDAAHEAVDLFVARVPDVLVTSSYLPIEVASGRMMLNQSYHDIAYWFPDMRPKLDGERFSLQSDPVVLEGPYVLIGGPIDRVWYHWLVSWCARISILRRVRPDLFNDPKVRFLISYEAGEAQFRESLMAMGVAEDRLHFVSHGFDYLLKDTILVTFPDQRFLYPDVVRAVASDMKAHFLDDTGPRPSPGRRIFASRQSIDHPKRRVANWDEVREVLDAFGFEVVSMGAESAASQVRMFAEAEFVLGVHGSDLANLAFCEPGATALVIENERNVYHGISASLDILCQITGVRYDCLIVDEVIDPDTDYSNFPDVHNRDVIVPPEMLRDRLIALGCLPLPSAVERSVARFTA